MEGLQDMRSLQLLEQLTDRETVLRSFGGGPEAPITFNSYPHEAAWLLSLRENAIEKLPAWFQKDSFINLVAFFSKKCLL